MKYIVLSIVSTFLIACGGSKKVIQTEKESKPNTEQVYQEPEVPEIKRTHRPKESDFKLAQKDSANLEMKEVKKTEAVDTSTIARHKSPILNLVWVGLLNRHVSDQGHVDYAGFKKDRQLLTSYLNLLGENPPQDDWTREDLLAYWINVYNAFTIKLIVDNYPVKSIKDIKDPWDYRFIKIGPKWYTLNDVEHKILRKMDEPRIHFAINCASVSCPKLLNEAFSPETLEVQLTKVTKDFLADTSRNVISEHNIRISKIFRWFGKDFKKNGTLIDFLNQYTDVTISSKAKVSFKDYDWNLNE